MNMSKNRHIHLWKVEIYVNDRVWIYRDNKIYIHWKYLFLEKNDKKNKLILKVGTPFATYK